MTISIWNDQWNSVNKVTIFFTCYFLLKCEVSVVFNVSPSHVITNLQNRHFLHEEF